MARRPLHDDDDKDESSFFFGVSQRENLDDTGRSAQGARARALGTIFCFVLLKPLREDPVRRPAKGTPGGQREARAPVRRRDMCRPMQLCC